MVNKKYYFFFVNLMALLTIVCQPSCAFSEGNYPLPDDLNIMAPGKDVPPKLAEFSGIWAGSWHKSPALYIMEKITPEFATIVFANAGSGGSIAKWVRYEKCAVKKLENDTYMITIRASDGVVIEFRQTNQPDYIQGIRSGADRRVDSRPINFERRQEIPN